MQKGMWVVQGYTDEVQNMLKQNLNLERQATIQHYILGLFIMPFGCYQSNPGLSNPNRYLAPSVREIKRWFRSVLAILP